MVLNPIEVKVKWTRKRPWKRIVPDKVEFIQNGYKITIEFAAIRPHVNAKHNIEWSVVEDGREYLCRTKALDINGTEANVWLEHGYTS